MKYFLKNLSINTFGIDTLIWDGASIFVDKFFVRFYVFNISSYFIKKMLNA